MSTMTEVFPCFFLSRKANARVKPAKMGHGPHSSYFLCCSMYFCVVLCIACFVSFSVLFVCICVLYYCHRMATQMQLNISYRMSTYAHTSTVTCFGIYSAPHTHTHTHLTRNCICSHIYQHFIITTHYYILFYHFNNS